MKVKELTVEQLKALIQEAVEEKLQEILGDPDQGLELKEEVIRKLQAHKVSNTARIPMEQVAKKFGIELEE